MDYLSRVPVVISSDICGSPELVKIFDGYRTVGEIIKNSPYFQSEIEDFIQTNLEQKKLVWKDEWSPLLWCHSCNLPLLEKTCDTCKKTSENRIDLKFPCNPRPIMEHDEHMFRKIGFPWPLGYSMMLNAYKHPDYWGWELIHGGKNIGDVIQSHENGDFEFIPSEHFDRAALAADKSTPDDLVKANTTRLKNIEKEAVAFMNSYKDSWRITIPVLGFSGGKDSVVLAHMASKTKFRSIYAYQINTGIEPQYNEDFSEAFLSSYKKFKIQKLFSKDMFWRAIKKLGPHALDFQWCRLVLKNLSVYREKKGLKMKIIHFLGRYIKPKMLVLHGARNREEVERVPLARTLKLGGSHPTMPTADVTTILPLSQLTDLDVWLYTHLHKLPINPAYTTDKGQRMLCMFCFEKNDYEFENDIKNYPDVYAKLEAELKVWQKKFNFPDEWVSKRLWRYNESNSSYMKKLRIVPRVDTVIEDLIKTVTFGQPVRKAEQIHVEGKIHLDFNLEELSGWFKALGKCKIKGTQLTVTPDFENIMAPLGAEKKSKSLLTIDADGTIKIESNDPYAVDGFVKLVNDWAAIHVNCIKCGACVKQTKLIEIDGQQLSIRKHLPLATVENIFKECPVHPKGIKNLMKPLSKEYTPTSCTSCFLKYKKDMNYVEPLESKV